MTVGQRIRVSRRACGLSLRDLEARIDNRVTAQAISKYERDESMPSSGVLIALSDALGVPVDYLASDSDIRLEAIDFRKKRLTSRREEAQVEARVLHLLERYLTVEEILALPTVWDMPREAPWPVLRDPAEAEHAALGLRGHWGLGLDPIPNLVDLFEERGIKVLAMSLTNIDGLTARVRREDRSVASVVVVNRNDWGERQRFTLAHELGHMALETASKIDDEKAAHRFAGAFLMPAETLRAEIGKHRKSMGWGRALRSQAHLRGERAGAHLPLQGPRDLRPTARSIPLQRIHPARLAQPAVQGAGSHARRTPHALRAPVLPRLGRGGDLRSQGRRVARTLGARSQPPDGRTPGVEASAGA